MVHLYLCSPFEKLSASKVAGSGNAPAGLSPVGQPWGRFHFGGDQKSCEILNKVSLGRFNRRAKIRIGMQSPRKYLKYRSRLRFRAAQRYGRVSW